MRRISPKTVIYVLVMVMALAYLSFTVTSTRPRPAGGRTAKRTPEPASATSKTEAARTTPLAQAAPSDAGFDRYQLVVARDVFSPPHPPAPPKARPSTTPPLVLTPEESRPKPAPPPPPPSLSSWSYVGYVTVDGGTVGILQNDETHSFKDLKRGDSFEGYRVEEISREEMGLSFGATRTSLKRMLDFPIVPLEGMAGAGQPGRPGGAAGGPRPRGGGPPERP